MAVQTTLPTTNLTFNDIRDTLNSGGGSVTNEVATAFKTTSGINKWAKYKPEDYAKDFDLTDANRKANYYSFNIPYNTSANGADTSFRRTYLGWWAYKVSVAGSGGSLDWYYRLPQGGSSSPMRLGDFRGYVKDAKCPVTTGVQNLTSVSQINRFDWQTLTFFRAPQGASSSNLPLGDIIPTASNTYFTAEIYKNLATNAFQSSTPTTHLVHSSNIAASEVQYLSYDIPSDATTLDIVLGFKQISGGSIIEGGGFVAPIISGYPFIKRYTIYNEFNRTVTSAGFKTGDKLSGSFITSTTSYTTTSSPNILIAFKVKQANKAIRIVNNWSVAAPSNYSKMMVRFYPTNSGTASVQASVGTAVNATGSTISGYYHDIPSGSGETTVYFLFSNVFKSTGTLTSGRLEFSIDGTSYSTNATASVSLNINKTS